MSIHYFRKMIFAIFCLFLTILSPLGKANMLYSVSLDTNNLVGNREKPFTLDFTLYNNGSTGDINNTIYLIDFNFLNGSFTLNDANSEAGVPFTQSGNPLSKLSFRVNTTNNLETPSDLFVFKILDKNGNPIPTTDPTDDSFLTIVLDSATGTVFKYGAPDNSAITIGAPTVQRIPTPSTGFLLMIGCCGLLVARRRLRSE